MGVIYTAARIAEREAGRPKPANQKPKEWQPFTKCVWAFFLFAIPIAMGGAARVITFVILGVIAASVLGGLLWALGRPARQQGERKDPVAEYLDQAEQQGGARR